MPVPVWRIVLQMFLLIAISPCSTPPKCPRATLSSGTDTKWEVNASRRGVKPSANTGFILRGRSNSLKPSAPYPWQSSSCSPEAWSSLDLSWRWSLAKQGTCSFQSRVIAVCLSHEGKHRDKWIEITREFKRAYGVAVAEMAGLPSKTMTRSARYVAMMKSCSMTNAVFFEWRMNLTFHDQ